MRFRSLLTQRAPQGIEVRVLYDAIDSASFNRRMSEVFETALEHSSEVDLEAFRRRPRRTRLLEGVARLFSPLL